VAVTRWGKKVTALPLIEMLVWQRERRTDQAAMRNGAQPKPRLNVTG
jgi:hypothetical protein